MATLPTYAATLSCIARGWSVIPLVGGAEIAHGKTSAVAWSRYRRALPSQANLQRWFVDQQFSAYGVVCGTLSKLIVIDFDDAAEFALLAGLVAEFSIKKALKFSINGEQLFAATRCLVTQQKPS